MIKIQDVYQDVFLIHLFERGFSSAVFIMAFTSIGFSFDVLKKQAYRKLFCVLLFIEFFIMDWHAFLALSDLFDCIVMLVLMRDHASPNKDV